MSDAQTLINIAGAVIAFLVGTLWSLTQWQIRTIRKDGQDEVATLRRDVTDRFATLNERYTERWNSQKDQHTENKAEMERLRQMIVTASETAASEHRKLAETSTSENHRILDALDRLMTRMATIPERDEVMRMITAAKHT